MPARANFPVRLLACLTLLPIVTACASGKAELRASSAATQAKAEIEKLIHGQYSAIERGDLSAWAAAFSTDALLLGSDPSEVMLGRETILSQMNKSAGSRMAADVQRTYRSTRLHIGLAPDGRAAWVADLIEYKRHGAGENKSVWFRMSAVVGKTASAETPWEVRVAHYSVAVPDKQAFATSWPLPVEIPASPAGDAGVTALFPAGPLDHFPGVFSERLDALLIGTSNEEWIVGGPVVRRFTRQGLPGKIQVQRRGDVRTGTAASLGWAAWNGSLTLPGQPTLPVRVLSVFLRNGDKLEKVAEHVSIAVPD